MSDEDDPFEELDDAVGDREGDPFESLGEGSEESAADGSDHDTEPFGSEHDTEPFGPENREPDTERETLDRQDPSRPPPGTEGEPESDADGESLADRGLFAPDEPTGADRSSPASGESSTAPADSVEQSAAEFDVGRREDDDPTRGEFFSDVGRREGDPFDSFEDAFDEMDVDKLDPDVVWQELASAESRGSVGDAQERTYADVSKHSYCEGCEYFSPPPDIACGHEGTEIVEFLDMETVRVIDCPIVTEREELEEDDGFGDA